MITFHLATQYISRVALRLEELFLVIDQAARDVNPLLHHYALKNTLDVVRLIDKPEIKSRFLQEFMRIQHAVSKQELQLPDNLGDYLIEHIQSLSGIAGNFAELIQNEPFLNSCRYTTPASNTGEADLHTPQVLFWLEHDATTRQNDLTHWLDKFEIVIKTVKLYLSLLRGTGQYERILLSNGYYQMTLPAALNTQLILLRMNKRSSYFPKLQLAQHNLTLRVYDPTTLEKVSDSNTSAELAICHL